MSIKRETPLKANNSCATLEYSVFLTDLLCAALISLSAHRTERRQRDWKREQEPDKWAV